ncbi:uncharacterized protein LOC117766073 [Hippoglossus hippoglossus]|uniref:uncharacterized protein LOC117766073 n=1 Tax=Hippoglossus hippoglossus TaxID=8267 RepID=UPI00148BA88F|nr:uncharacterized protein LOC117766073 [Hippoglossus hippoglossus]
MSTGYSSEPSYQKYPANAGPQQVATSAQMSYKPSNPARPQPGPNTGSSTHGGGSQNVPHLVYEEVFQYPSENAAQSPSDGGVSNTAGGAGYMSTGYSSEPSYQKYPANAGAQQVATSAQMSYQPQNPVASPEKEVSVRVSEPLLPPPPPSSYIVQSRDSYRRSRYLFNKSRYSPGFAPPLAVRSVPARRQPAAPVGVKNPQSTTHTWIVSSKERCKPWINGDVHAKLKARTDAYNSGDLEEYRKSRYTLRSVIRSAKRHYRDKVESHYQGSNTRNMRAGLKTISDYKRKTSSAEVVSASLPEELNTFYAHFESNCGDTRGQEGLLPPGNIQGRCVEIT